MKNLYFKQSNRNKVIKETTAIRNAENSNQIFLRSTIVIVYVRVINIEALLDAESTDLLQVLFLDPMQYQKPFCIIIGISRL